MTHQNRESVAWPPGQFSPEAGSTVSVLVATAIVRGRTMGRGSARSSQPSAFQVKESLGVFRSPPLLWAVGGNSCARAGFFSL